MLRDDLGLQIPRENEHKSWSLSCRSSSDAGSELRTWGIPSVLTGADVYGEIQEILAYAAVIEKRVALPGRSVTNHFLPLRSASIRKSRQGPLVSAPLFSETCVRRSSPSPLERSRSSSEATLDVTAGEVVSRMGRERCAVGRHASATLYVSSSSP